MPVTGGKKMHAYIDDKKKDEIINQILTCSDSNLTILTRLDVTKDEFYRLLAHDSAFYERYKEAKALQAEQRIDGLHDDLQKVDAVNARATDVKCKYTIHLSEKFAPRRFGKVQTDDSEKAATALVDAMASIAQKLK